MLAGAEKSFQRIQIGHEVSEAVDVLMAQVIDYAGLFPPAECPMQEAVRNYGHYRRGPHARMLGRFVLPVARLPEFVRDLARERGAGPEGPWLLSLLGSKDAGADAEIMQGCQRAGTCFDSIELRAQSSDEVTQLLALYPDDIPRYLEFPPERVKQIAPLLAGRGVRAKIRMGGTTVQAIPEAGVVAQFLATCAEHKVPFKATAGLHHAVRVAAPLTYAADSPSATMHGFLNLFFAALLAYEGAEREVVTAVLQEEERGAFHASRDEFFCNQRSFSTVQIAKARRKFILGMASCSFLEPLLDLQELGWE
jgi:hypothetical protein